MNRRAGRARAPSCAPVSINHRSVRAGARARRAARSRARARSRRRKTAGNEAFKAGKLEAAIALYDRAVEVLEKGDARGGGGGASDEERRIIQGKLARDTLQVRCCAGVHRRVAEPRPAFARACPQACVDFPPRRPWCTGRAPWQLCIRARPDRATVVR